MLPSEKYPPQLPIEQETDAAFSIVVAYQDAESGEHAQRTCDFLMEALASECRLVRQMWKFDALAMPSLREMAANDAAMADVIVIATRGEEDLPADVKAWSELWLGRQSSAFALVALFTEPDQHAERVKTTQSYLGWIAARGGMEFFAQPDVWPEDLASRRFTQKRGGDDSRSTIFSVAAVPTRNTNVGHWGLNE